MQAHSSPGPCRSIAVLPLLVVVAIIAGCGTPGQPLPPSLKLPVRVTDLSADRAGDSVHLSWTTPQRTTDRLPIKGDVRVKVCRAVEAGPCSQVAELPFAPGSDGVFDDALPPGLVSGAPRLLTYTVEVRNRSGRSAGPSNEAFTAAGATPSALAGFTARVRAEGVALHWTAASTLGAAIRIHRTLVASPTAEPQRTGSAPVRGMPDLRPAEPVRLTLQVSSDAGGALDHDAAFDRTYRYQAERVAHVTVGGHAVEIAGSSSSTVTVETRDTFPPAVPLALAAVAAPAEAGGSAAAIDLSWAPDTDADIAGYFVYRREAGPAAAPQRLATGGPVVAPAFRDLSARSGIAYAYSVSAVDFHGNESARSAEVEETLPSN